jgi:trehalose/maltose hydrolase-like predicted phosphorylase
MRSALAVSACLSVIAAAGLAPTAAAAASPPAGDAASDTGNYLLTATDTGADYAPTFTGNGYLGVRVPPAGQGYASGDVPAQSELAGFYALPNTGQPSQDVQQRANIPTWDTLTLNVGGTDFSLASGTTSGWRQQLNLRDGTITTSATWTAPNGQTTDISYTVFTDRARDDVGAVQLRLTPRWSGTADVTDLIDGTPANLSSVVDQGRSTAKNQDWETVRTEGLGVEAALASQLGASSDVRSVTTPVDPGGQSIGQRLSFDVAAGHSYTITKYVGVTSSNESAQPEATARRQAATAAALGYDALRAENAKAWAALWKGRVDIEGDTQLATEVNASEFYLWSSTTAGVNWSVSPAGLSSNGYDGHIFWDAETWMYPTLLAQHPDIAVGMDNYRYNRLPQAQAHAQATGFTGARFPWESAFDGTEQIPPPASVNSEGLYEQHITADIALAQWQYYLATGDLQWLRTRGWPVISGAAAFWAGRAIKGSDGAYHISDVTGPDEENPDVNDEAYTNAAAATTLKIATQAARLVGASVPASYDTIANGLAVPVSNGVIPEFSGYQGQMVKQADVTMLQYPWNYPMSSTVAQDDLDYYVPRSDPGGPSMDDAINSIDSAALGSPGCSSWVYTERSVEPFMRDVFDQFSETRTGGAFTFMTGIGGFLQEFLYGYSGLRWDTAAVQLDPSLTSQLQGVVLHDIAWHGSRFDVAIGQHDTKVTLDSGPAIPVDVAGATHTLAPGRPLTIPTRRPDLTSTTDALRCGAATASSAQPGADALAAVDGSSATGWQPTQLPATFTAPMSGERTISSATVDWGQQWPGVTGPNVPPAPGPVTTLRPSSYTLAVSSDGKTWHTVATESNTGSATQDVLSFAPVKAKYLRLSITSASNGTLPVLDELTAR